MEVFTLLFSKVDDFFSKTISVGEFNFNLWDVFLVTVVMWGITSVILRALRHDG